MAFSFVAARPKDAPFCARAGQKGASVSRSSRPFGELVNAARAPHGLGQARRLTQKADFERLLKAGTRRSRSGYTFFVARRPAGPARLGILISRKHAAKATVRNRIKRCIREAFRLEHRGLGSVDVLVRPPFGAKPGVSMLGRLRELISGLGR
jgi:ribonuclease P protein component